MVALAFATVEPLVVETEAGNATGFGLTSRRHPKHEDLTLTAYLRDIAPFPLLSVEQERMLAHRVAQGDNDAKRQLIESNLRLVVRIAKRYVGHTVPLEDLIQAGNLGLMRAVETYDLHLGYRFSTHAVPWIRQSVSRFLMNTDRSIRVPVHLHCEIGAVMRASAHLADEQGTEPTLEQIARMMDLPIAQVARLRQLAQPLLSLDRPISAHSSMTVAESLPDEETPPLEELLARREEQARFHAALPALLAMLSKRERHLLVLRFGLLDGNARTLAEIGRLLGGLSRERVRQLEARALVKLKEALDSVSLHPVCAGKEAGA